MKAAVPPARCASPTARSWSCPKIPDRTLRIRVRAAAHRPQGRINRDCAGRDDRDRHHIARSQPDDRSFPDALALIAEPRPALLDHVLRHAQIHEVAFARDAFAVNDVELSLAERRRQFVLYHLDFGPVTDHSLAILDRGDAADIDTYGGIEF